MKSKYQDKARGMMVGLAVGDALGAPVEFGYTSDSIKSLGDKISHFYNSPRGSAGDWTDDTSMALCISDSLLEQRGYDSYDIMDRFYKWVKEGYRSHNGKPADDVGNQTRLEITKYHRNPVRSSTEAKTDSAGNAPIMRLAPIILANTSARKDYPSLDDGYKMNKLAIDPKDSQSEFINQKDIEPTINMAILSCRETHNSTAAEATTALFATMLYCALHGLSKQNIVTYCSRWIFDDQYDQFWLENFDNLIGRALKKEGNDLKDLGGYIVDAFTIALWGLLQYDSFEDGMLAVIRLGGDTDTNGACYGQLAGAYYGFDAIPDEWKQEIYLSDEITSIADRLLDMDECPVIRTRFEGDEHFQTPETTQEHLDNRQDSQLSDDNVQDIGKILRERFGDQLKH